MQATAHQDGRGLEKRFLLTMTRCPWEKAGKWAPPGPLLGCSHRVVQRVDPGRPTWKGPKSITRAEQARTQPPGPPGGEAGGDGDNSSYGDPGVPACQARGQARNRD